jgi:hypothetical protein
MARRHQARDYLLQGLTPERIAGRMGISLSSVRQYLCTVLGEGELLRTDITFSIEKTHRKVIEEGILKVNLHDHGAIYSKLHRTRRRPPQEVISLYLLTRDPRPDLYDLICRIDVLLHRLVKRVLLAAHGEDWWRKGIPERIRIECQARREQDETPVPDPYQYTTFIDVKQIIEKEWTIFSKTLPKNMILDKRRTLMELQKINSRPMPESCLGASDGRATSIESAWTSRKSPTGRHEDPGRQLRLD